MPEIREKMEELLKMTRLCAENSQVECAILDFDRFGESNSSGHERVFFMAFGLRWMQLVKLLKAKKPLDRHFIAGGPIG